MDLFNRKNQTLGVDLLFDRKAVLSYLQTVVKALNEEHEKAIGYLRMY